MSFSLAWSFVAHRDLLSLPWRTAARIDAAVMRFAETGRGGERVVPGDPTRQRIRVVGAAATSTSTWPSVVYVQRVFPRGQ